MNAAKLWDQYWFRPVPLIYLGMTRVVIVGYQLFHLIVFDVMGRVRGAASFPQDLYDALPVVHLLLLPFGWHARPSLEVLEIVYAVTFAAGFFSLAGLYSRPSMAVFAVGNLLMQGYLYSFGILHHSEAIMMIALTILVFSPAGARLSPDHLRRRMTFTSRKKKNMEFNPFCGRSRLACWPLLLIQRMFALIYMYVFSRGCRLGNSGGPPLRRRNLSRCRA